MIITQAFMAEDELNSFIEEENIMKSDIVSISVYPWNLQSNGALKYILLYWKD